ncbi:MAG: pilus assembly protein N-terminal domain-containing protein, partial [Candidatus Omnitrophica bacterium]|nr:pilus assembly protein N-terminal domain-containing protein [Candidatus Omnitrophota bacterium]
MELGKKAIDYKEYENAYEFFKYASIVEPESQEPSQYLNLLKRLREGNVEGDRKVVSKEGVSNEQEGTVEDKLGDFSRTRDAAVREALDVIEDEFYSDSKDNDRLMQGTARDISVKKALPVGKRIVKLPDEVKKKKSVVIEKTNGIFGFAEPLYLNAEVENSQPNTRIRLELNQSLIIEGESIKRLLAITPGVIESEIVGQDQIKVSAIRIGSTYLHIWDQNKRWTFNVEIIFPIRKSSIKSQEDQEEEKGEPFKFAYSADWTSYYDGNSIRSLERNHLNYIQWAGIYGETPYGKMDASATFNMFDQSTEVTGYGVGLTNGKIGNFKDFTIRGFDTSKEFSDLTLPGKSFRGFILDAYAFDHRVAYSYMHGRDKSTFSRVSAGILEKQESFLEGFKMTLFPDQENNVSFNFARGYGIARSEQLKDRVFSVQGQRRIKDVMFDMEVAYDEMNI